MRLRNRMTMTYLSHFEQVEAHQVEGVPIRVSRLIGVSPRDSMVEEQTPSII